MASRITLHAFTADLRQTVEAFEAHWLAERVRNPKDWPATQPTMEDWQDQFLAWLEAEKESRTS